MIVVKKVPGSNKIQPAFICDVCNKEISPLMFGRVVWIVDNYGNPFSDECSFVHNNCYGRFSIGRESHVRWDNLIKFEPFQNTILEQRPKTLAEIFAPYDNQSPYTR